MAKFEKGGWVNPHPNKETSGEFIIRHSKKFSIGLSNYQAREYKIFHSWKEVIDELHFSINQIRRIRTGCMVYGWQLQHINGKTFYKKNLRSSYVKKGTNNKLHPICVESPDGDIRQYSSMREATDKTGLSYYILRRLIWGYPHDNWKAWNKNSI